jgi:glucokinase
MAGPVVAIDLGGTAMKGAVVREPGSLEHVETRPTGREDGPDAVLERLATFAADLAGAAVAPVAAVGVAVPGIVDEDAGVARASVNVGWRDVALRERLEPRLGVPVAVGHDVRAAARAEGRLGAARGHDDWLLVAVGTGVGAAVVVGGEPYGGAHGTGGELGHVVVAPDGPECGCGARGCVEAIASASAIARHYGGEGITAREVAQRAGAGDARAAAVWRDAVDALAAGLAAYVMVMDPRLVVVGGGVADAGDALFGPLAAGLGERLTFVPAPPVVPAELGAEAGCHGAALMALEAAA